MLGQQQGVGGQDGPVLPLLLSLPLRSPPSQVTQTMAGRLQAASETPKHKTWPATVSAPKDIAIWARCARPSSSCLKSCGRLHSISPPLLFGHQLSESLPAVFRLPEDSAESLAAPELLK